MKKLTFLIIALVSGAAFANQGSSSSLSVGMAVDQQLSIVAELENQYRFIVGNEGAAFDYLAVRGQFEQHPPLSWYAGVGGWAEWKDDFGFRVPLGLNYQIGHGWDVYAQLHPELNLYKGPELGIGGALGIKYAF